MQNKKVSIVIPTFNRKHYLSQCIDSCLNQTYECEIIVCDHGSTDGTKDFMDKYKDKVTYIRREKDFGPHFCWLEGILNSSGEFIHLQFDDDWIEDTFIEKTVALMNDDVGCAIANFSMYDEQNDKFRNLQIFKEIFKKTGIYNKKELEKRILFRSGFFSPGCCLFRKNILIDSLYQGSLPLKNTDNYHGVGPDIFVMLLSFLRYEKVGITTENLAIFREHSGSITCNAMQNIDTVIKIRNAYLETVNFYYFIKILHPIFKYLNIYSLFRIISGLKHTLKNKLKNKLKNNSSLFRKLSALNKKRRLKKDVTKRK